MKCQSVLSIARWYQMTFNYFSKPWLFPAQKGGREEGSLRAVRPTGGIPPPPHLPSSSASSSLPKGRSVWWAQSVCAQRREKVKSWPHSQAAPSPQGDCVTVSVFVFWENIGIFSQQYWNVVAFWAVLYWWEIFREIIITRIFFRYYNDNEPSQWSWSSPLEFNHPVIAGPVLSSVTNSWLTKSLLIAHWGGGVALSADEVRPVQLSDISNIPQQYSQP